MSNYIFDIDGTIADTPEKEYDKAEPDEAMIALVNMLYDQGHHIIIITARGTSSGIDWEVVTKNQLKKWGVHYHELIFGMIISDKVITPEDFLNDI